MTLIELHSVLTALLFIIFVGIVIWAYSGKRKKTFETAAQMPLANDDAPGDQDGARAPVPPDHLRRERKD